MQRNSSKRAAHIRSPAIPRGPPRRSRTGVGKDLWPTRSSLTLPKWYLATLNNYYKQTTLLDLHNSSYSTSPNNCNKEAGALDWLHWSVFLFLNDDDQEDFKFSKRIPAFLLSASKPQSTYIREFKQQPRTPTATKTSLNIQREFALLQTWSLLFHLVQFVNWRRFFWSWILKAI